MEFNRTHFASSHKRRRPFTEISLNPTRVSARRAAKPLPSAASPAAPVRRCRARVREDSVRPWRRRGIVADRTAPADVTLLFGVLLTRLTHPVVRAEAAASCTELSARGDREIPTPRHLPSWAGYVMAGPPGTSSPTGPATHTPSEAHPRPEADPACFRVLGKNPNLTPTAPKDKMGCPRSFLKGTLAFEEGRHSETLSPTFSHR